MKKLTPAGLKNKAVKTLKDNKAIDVVALDIKKLTDIADYMIICTANSTTHVKTLIKKVREQLALSQIKPIGIEGENACEWMLADFGDVIVHVMLKPTREFYNLEKLWGLEKIKESAARKEQDAQ
jgi:ribosome-associated protein